MDNGYKSLLKATIVMSGAQIIEALMSIVRAKVIALLLGPIGIALNSIFLITLNTLYQVTSVGLPQSAIRDIAQSQNSENPIEPVSYTHLDVYKRQKLYSLHKSKRMQPTP